MKEINLQDLGTFSMTEKRELGTELRKVVSATISNLMDMREEVVALDADLGGASSWTSIAKKHPAQFINVGISEANMVGVAAGMSANGFVPFIHTFGPFATRRVLDQLYLSGAYSKNTINIWGSDPGFTAGFNGGTHTTWEDIALLRSIPDVVICDAADAVQMEWIIREFAKLSGIHYVRGNRKGIHDIYAAGSKFELGKGNILRKGENLLLIAAGQLVYEALEIAESLEKSGITTTVIDMFTIKPLDQQIILDNLAAVSAIVTIENHSIYGGLGSAVAEVLAENAVGKPLKRIGVDNRFGQVGTPAFLQQEFGLTTEIMENKILSFMEGIK